MGRRVLVGVVVGCVAVGLPPAALADGPKDSWDGQSVVPKLPPKQITFGDRPADDQASYEFSGAGSLTVRGDRAGWLRLFDGLREGWAKKDQFVLSRDAPAYFGDRVRADPSDPFPWLMRGVAWIDRGEFDRAIKDFDEVIRLYPACVPAFNDRGYAWQEKGEYGKAVRDYDEAIRLSPKDVFALNNRGRARVGMREYDRAMRDFDEAIRLDPKYSSAFLNRGNAWFGKGDYGTAVRDYDEAIRLDPKDAAAFRSRGLARAARNEYDEAVRDCDEVIRLAPNSPIGFTDRGNVRCEKKEYGSAARDYDEAVRLDPKNAAALSARAWLMATCPVGKYRDGKRAVEDARTACELDGWKDLLKVGNLAAAYAEAGQYDDAVRWQKKALADPDYEKYCGSVARKLLKLYEERKPFRQGSE